MTTCKQCKTSFEITDADRAFYKKRGVPEPTLCPQCRHQRRLAIRNERTFYPGTCASCKKSIISYFHPEKPHKVYCPECWYSDTWDAFEHGRDFDFSQPFFPQFKELYEQVPTLSLDVVNCKDSQFVSYCGDDKRCYLDIAGEANQDCYYCKFTKYSVQCVDCSFVYNSELNYECVNCHRVYGCRYTDRCLDSNNLSFCYDCRGCQDCFGCWNLRNKKYHIFNKAYTPEEYKQKIVDYNLNSYAAVELLKKEMGERITKEALVCFAQLVNSEDCTGDDLNNCKSVHESFDVTKAENSKWLCDVLDAKECYDLDFSLYKPEASVELISTLNMTYSAFCCASHYCNNTWYSDKCNNSSDLFGCIGLNKKSYSIFNKQYSKEDYAVLRERIVAHMKKTGEWGEFFPIGTSGFGYNETVAQEYFLLNEDECKKNGWAWWDKTPFTKGKETLKATGISDMIQDVPETLVKEILACVDCGRNYKVIAQELAFYKKIGVPVPRQCTECRHHARNKRAGERVLHHRQCMCSLAGHDHTGRCPHEFETTYAPERPEKVFCEQCYQKEIL